MARVVASNPKGSCKAMSWNGSERDLNAEGVERDGNQSVSTAGGDEVSSESASITSWCVTVAVTQQHTGQIGSSVSPREVVGIEGRMVANKQQTKWIEIRNPDCKSNNADGLCVICVGWCGCQLLVWWINIYGMPCSSVRRAQPLVGFGLHTGMRSAVRVRLRQLVFHGYLVFLFIETRTFCAKPQRSFFSFSSFFRLCRLYLPSVRLAGFVLVINEWSVLPASREARRFFN